MRVLKRILLGIVILLVLATVLSIVLLKVENDKTSYLKIENQPKLKEDTYLIKNVNVVPMNMDTVLLNTTIRVENGRVEAIGENHDAGDIAVIDANGGYLTPGLIDMHMHLWDKFELGLYLANGVTTVRSLLGMPFHLDVKREVNEGKIIAPLFYTASPQFSGADDTDIMKKPIKDSEEARKLVIEYKKQGYDYIKTYNLLPKDIFDEVLEQASETGIPVISHPSFEVDYDYHFNPLITTVEHTEDIFQQPLNYRIDREKLKSVIDGYALSGQTHCPTLSVFYNLVEIYNKGEEMQHGEYVKYMNSFVTDVAGDYERHMEIRESDSTSTKRINEQHKFHLEIVNGLYNAGVNIVCGTDAGIVYTAPGFSIHQELDLYKQAGMSNYDALKTATVNPTKVYDDYKQFGTIEIGKMANFVLSKENPLHDLSTLRNPEWVMVKGRLIDKPLIDEFKEKASDRNNYLATMIRVFKYVLWDK